MRYYMWHALLDRVIAQQVNQLSLKYENWENCYQRLYWQRHIDTRGRKEMFYLTTHSTHFKYSYMASDGNESPELVTEIDPRGSRYEADTSAGSHTSQYRVL